MKGMEAHWTLLGKAAKRNTGMQVARVSRKKGLSDCWRAGAAQCPVSFRTGLPYQRGSLQPASPSRVRATPGTRVMLRRPLHRVQSKGRRMT